MGMTQTEYRKFRARLVEHGLSIRSLARILNVSHSYIIKVAKGDRRNEKLMELIKKLSNGDGLDTIGDIAYIRCRKR